MTALAPICAACSSMHEVEGMLARLFAERRVERDISTEERLNSCANIAHERARANDNAARDTEILRHTISVQFKCAGNHCVVYCCHAEMIPQRYASNGPLDV